jgi:inhibitor of cysteine peptidase
MNMYDTLYPVSIQERQIENGRIQMRYPEVRGLRSQELQRKVNEKIQDVIYKTIWSHGFEKDPELMITGNTQITLNRAGVLSIVFRLRFGSGETPAGFLKVKALTLDLRNGAVYKFEDLFKNDGAYIARINKIIQRQIMERDIPLVKKFKTIERNQRFYLTADSLIIYFPRHEYSGGSFGILEFAIPYPELRDLAYEKGPLIRMVLQKIMIGENDNGETVSIMKDQSLELSLTTNPSTGYTWQYVQKANPGVLRETRHFLSPQNKKPGAPSLEYWIYIPVNAGTTSIVLQYSRSWSKEPPLKTFQVNIVVS